MPVVAVRGERLALTRLELGTEDESPGAPHEECCSGYWVSTRTVESHCKCRSTSKTWTPRSPSWMPRMRGSKSGLSERRSRTPRVEPMIGCSRCSATAHGRDRSRCSPTDIRLDDRRQGLRRESNDRATAIAKCPCDRGLGRRTSRTTTLALRGDRLCLSHMRFEERATRPAGFCVESTPWRSPRSTPTEMMERLDRHGGDTGG